jgi:hypothetical protein
MRLKYDMPPITIKTANAKAKPARTFHSAHCKILSSGAALGCEQCTARAMTPKPNAKNPRPVFAAMGVQLPHPYIGKPIR